jgi:hypothetical protein
MAKIINSLWVGRPLSAIERLCITSFLQNGHEFHLYCYDKIGNIPDGTVLRDATEILPASEIFSYQHGNAKGSLAAFANLFRLKFLLERGGWWVDTDVVCLRPFDFEEDFVFASERTYSGSQATNAVLKFPKGHKIARLYYETAERKNRAQMKWGEIGPLLIDRIVRENGLESFVKPPEVFCPLANWQWTTLLSPKPLAQMVTGKTRAVHLWHEHWRRAGTKINPATFEIPPKTLWQKFAQKTGLKPKQTLAATPFGELLHRFGLNNETMFSV